MKEKKKKEEGDEPRIRLLTTENKLMVTGREVGRRMGKTGNGD